MARKPQLLHEYQSLPDLLPACQGLPDKMQTLSVKICWRGVVPAHVHHTRITELVRLGIRGQTLHKLVGWTKRSNMEAVYVHLSTADVENEVRTKVFGLEEDKD